MILTVRNTSAEEGQHPATYSRGKASIHHLDLTSLDLVVNFANTVFTDIANGKCPRLTSIVCNAYRWNQVSEPEATEDSYEKTIQVSHIPHVPLVLRFLGSIAPEKAGRLKDPTARKSSEAGIHVIEPALKRASPGSLYASKQQRVWDKSWGWAKVTSEVTRNAACGTYNLKTMHYIISSRHIENTGGPVTSTSDGASMPTEDDAVHKVLRDSLRAGDIEIVKQKLRDNSQLASDKFGELKGTIIHAAIRHFKGNEIDILSMLKAICNESPGVNTDAADSDGRTALHLAVWRKYVSIIDWLLKDRRGDPNVRDNKQSAPLRDAIIMPGDTKRYEVVHTLLQRGADPNIRDLNQQTAFHRAASQGNYSIVKLLLTCTGIDINARDQWGGTALFGASRWDRNDVVKLLIDSGADIEARSNRWNTPLHIAASHNAAGAVTTLVQAGAPVICYNRALKTPEMIARERGHDQVVNALWRLMGDTAQLSGKKLTVSTPSHPDQVAAAKMFKGLIWPGVNESVRDPLSFETPTVWDMVYASEPNMKSKLEGLASKHQAESTRPRWIHIPGNNRTWIEDVFKSLYTVKDIDSYKDAPNRPARKRHHSRAYEAALEDAKLALQAVLSFVSKTFNHRGGEMMSRQGHWMTNYETRFRNIHIASLSLPFLDVDMQQPGYFTPDLDPEHIRGDTVAPRGPVEGRMPMSRWLSMILPVKGSKVDQTETSGVKPEADIEASTVRAYTTHPGRDLDNSDKQYVANLINLHQSYNSGLQLSSSLDEYFHEFLDERGLWERNGDQVISRFIARNWWRADRDKETKKHEGHEGASTGHKDDSDTDDDGEGGDDHDKPSMMQATESEAAEAAHKTTGTHHPKTTTEKTDPQEASTNIRPSLDKVRTAEEFTPRDLEEGQISPSEPKSSFWHRNRHTERHIIDSAGVQVPPSTHNSEENGDGSSYTSLGPEKTAKVKTPNAKQTRQQILVVPQIWLWRVGNNIITSFPERWDRSNSGDLLRVIYERLTRRDDQARGSGFSNLSVENIIEELVRTCLEFEPFFPNPGGERSYLDAFGGEIAFVSRKITKCYETYRKSLGETVKNFEAAIKEETEYLLMIDDILGEITMIKGVQQDQDRIGIAIHRTLSHDNSDASDSYVLHDENPLRSAESRYMVTKLDRLDEDARRIRNSIITLLDLRQRQATTENAISSSRQSDILFAQSKVLFVFTAATVVFAPLSWVSSLMAINIENFSFDPWPQGRVIGGSMGSVLVTLLLCILGWRIYEVSGAADAKENSERNRERMNQG